MKNLIFKILIVTTVNLVIINISRAQSSIPEGPPPDETRGIQINHKPSMQIIDGEYGIWYKESDFECSNKYIDTETHNTNNLITKPFIIVEGIDFGNAYESKSTYGAINDDDAKKGILEVLRRDGWDIIVLNLFDNTTDIRHNALLLEELINNVNNEVVNNHNQHGTPIHRPVVMGVSMGGLIVRYCLTDMEHRGIDHKVEKYISFDGPNKGANVPLGLQHLVDYYLNTNQTIALRHQFPPFMENIIKRNDPHFWLKNFLGSNLLVDLIDAKAALQMALMITECGNPSRTEFLNDLSDIGNYPEKCRKIAISNGASGTENRQPGLEPGSELFSFNTRQICIEKRIPGDGAAYPWVDITFCPMRSLYQRVYAMPGGSIGLNSGGPGTGAICEAIAPKPYQEKKLVSELAYEIDFFPEAHAESRVDFIPDLNVGKLSVEARIGRSNWYRNIESKDKNINADHVAGGYYSMKSIFEDMDSKLEKDNDPIIEDLRIVIIDQSFKEPITGIGFDVEIVLGAKIEILPPNIDYKPQFSFIPTVSSLDIQTEDWEYDAASLGNYTQNTNATPFDAIYTHFRNSEHAFIDIPVSGPFVGRLDMPEFMLEELSPEQLYIQNRTFEAGYVNTFESRNFIAVGNDVDPVEGRSNIGDVIVEEGASVTFSVPAVSGDPDAGFVYFDDGFDSNGGDVEVIFNELPNCGGRLLASASDNIDPDPNWQTLRRTRVTHQKPEQEDPFEKLEYFDEIEADAKHIYEGTFGASISPNPYSDDVVLNLFLPAESTVAATVFATDGTPVTDIRFSGVLNSGSHEFHLKELRSLTPGAYLIKIQTEETTKTIKVIKH